MSTENDLIKRKYAVIKEQLIALCALNKFSPTDNDKFAKLLAEDIKAKSINSQYFTSLCYYILGCINAEERDKYISWPLVNLQTQSKFRKGVSALVNLYQDKYPWAHLKKIPESYFMVPHKFEARVFDFMSTLINLAIHLTLNDPETLLMSSKEKIISSKANKMHEIISKATKKEEELLENNIFCIEEFHDVKNEVCDKCISINQLNNELKKELNDLIEKGISEKLLPEGKKKIEIKDLLEIRQQKDSELNKIIEDLLKFRMASEEFLEALKTMKNPVSLCGKDFGCDTVPHDLSQATSRALGSLCQFFHYVTAKKATKEDEDNYYKLLNKLKNCLIEENETLTSCLS